MYRKIAFNLKYERESRGLSQLQLSKLVPISQPKLSYYESGEHIPPVDIVWILADFYKISIDELVGRI